MFQKDFKKYGFNILEFRKENSEITCTIIMLHFLAHHWCMGITNMMLGLKKHQ